MEAIWSYYREELKSQKDHIYIGLTLDPASVFHTFLKPSAVASTASQCEVRLDITSEKVATIANYRSSVTVNVTICFCSSSLSHNIPHSAGSSVQPG